MQIQVFNTDLDFLGICEEINDCEWVREYYKGGHFTMSAKLTEHNLSLLKKDRIIVKDGNYDDPMMIEYRELSEGYEGDEDFLITGNSLTTRILSSRITESRQVEKGTVDKVMKNILLKQMQGSYRAIEGLICSEDSGEFDEIIEHSSLYKSLDEDFETLSRLYDVGHRISIDIHSKAFIFDVYKGEDLSDKVLFSVDFDNLSNQRYISSHDNYKNVAYVLGQGSSDLEEDDDESRDKVIINNEEYTGWDRREVYIDARDINKDVKKTTDKDGNTVETPIHNGANAVKLLTARGKERLVEHLPIESFESGIVENNYKYKEDFDIGSVVSVRNKNWGVELTQRITKIVEEHNIYGTSIEVSFGVELPTIYDKLQQRMNRGMSI